MPPQGGGQGHQVPQARSDQDHREDPVKRRPDELAHAQVHQGPDPEGLGIAQREAGDGQAGEGHGEEEVLGHLQPGEPDDLGTGLLGAPPPDGRRAPDQRVV